MRFFKGLLLLGVLINCSWAGAAAKLRIGWQVPWAVQGQLVQILKHTDILKKHGLEVEFIGKSFGPELNELALGGHVDVILTADQPAATLFSKSEDWMAIGRLMYNRTATYAPMGSKLASPKDLKGKTIGVPVGAAAQRITAEALEASGMDSKKDVTWVNLGIQEHLPLALKGGVKASKWDQFDALSGFDPVPAVLETKGLAKMLHVGKVCSMILANKKWAEKNKQDQEKIIAAFADAYKYYQEHKKEANQWFMAEAKFAPENEAALALTESLEPNLTTKSIRMKFNADDLVLMQKGADFIAGGKGKGLDMKKHIMAGAIE